MSCKYSEYTELTDELKQASLGYEYHNLKLFDTNWASNLHNNGNILEFNILKNYAKYGLINWYMDKISETDSSINLNYELEILENKLINNNIQYYQLKNFGCILKYFKIKFPIITELCNTDRYKIEQKYKDMTHKKLFLILIEKNKIIKDNMIELIQSLKIIIDSNPLFNKMSLLDFFIENNEDIVNLTIIFLRLKIIIELALKPNNIHKIQKINNIYQLDKICDILQKIIYNSILSFYKNCKEEKFTIKLQDCIELNKDNELFIKLMKDKDILLYPIEKYIDFINKY